MLFLCGVRVRACGQVLSYSGQVLTGMDLFYLWEDFFYLCSLVKNRTSFGSKFRASSVQVPCKDNVPELSDLEQLGNAVLFHGGIRRICTGCSRVAPNRTTRPGTLSVLEQLGNKFGASFTRWNLHSFGTFYIRS